MNPKHQLFCETYLCNGRNATQAYLSVYKKVAEPTARANGSKLLTITNIANFISQRTNDYSQNLGITRDSQLEKLKDLYQLSYAVGDNKGCIKAIEVQNKMLGLDAPTKLELTGKDGGNLKVEIKPLPLEWLQPK